MRIFNLSTYVSPTNTPSRASREPNSSRSARSSAAWANSTRPAKPSSTANGWPFGTRHRSHATLRLHRNPKKPSRRHHRLVKKTMSIRACRSTKKRAFLSHSKCDYQNTTDHVLLERITLNPNLMAGKPVIKGTRLPSNLS